MHWEGAFGYDTHSIAWEGSHTTTWEKKRGDHSGETVIFYQCGSSEVIEQEIPQSFEVNDEMKRKPHFSTDQKEFQQLVSAHAIHVFPFDIEQEQALFGSEKQAELRAHANAVIQKKESADHLKELHLNLSLISCATEELYFPLYMGTFKYQEQSFEFAIDGKDPDRMKLPIIHSAKLPIKRLRIFQKLVRFLAGPPYSFLR